MKKTYTVCDDPACDSEGGHEYAKVYIYTKPDDYVTIDICYPEHGEYSRGVVELYFDQEHRLVMVNDRLQFYRGKDLERDFPEFLEAVRRAMDYHGI